MNIKIKIKTIFGKVLFELENEGNSIKQTLIEAIKRGTDLKDADLRDADLRGVNLRCVNLQGAYLPIFSKWSMVKLENTFKIGCKEKTFEDWELLI